MTSWNGKNFHITGPLRREFTSHWWIPLTKASDAELWCFPWSAPWINGWVNNCEPGDLRCYPAHYDIIVMFEDNLCGTGAMLKLSLNCSQFIYTYICVTHWHWVISGFVNPLRPKRNEQRFADDIFKRIFFNENVWILIKISLKFVPKGPINSIPALVQIMAWCRSGNKPLSEPMMVSLPMHICITRPQWVNGFLSAVRGDYFQIK